VLPASVSDANVPARISPAAPIAGPVCRSAIAAACRASRPSLASSRSRAIIKML
jgi:hypothetical protein